MKFLVKLSVALCLFSSFCLAGGPTTHTITICWSSPGNNGSSGRAYLYDIRFSTAPIDSANWNQASRASTMPLPANPGLLQICTIDNLTPNTTYYFRMNTADGAYNWSGLSNECSMTTCGGVCADIPGNVDCSLDNEVDISDLTVLIQYLYVSTHPMCICHAEANVDSDPFNIVDISDMTRLTDYLFISHTPLLRCF